MAVSHTHCSQRRLPMSVILSVIAIPSRSEPTLTIHISVASNKDGRAKVETFRESPVIYGFLGSAVLGL